MKPSGMRRLVIATLAFVAMLGSTLFAPAASATTTTSDVLPTTYSTVTFDSGILSGSDCEGTITNWTSPGNALGNDSSYASYGDDTAENCALTTYAFPDLAYSLPPNATVASATVEVDAWQTGTADWTLQAVLGTGTQYAGSSRWSGDEYLSTNSITGSEAEYTFTTDDSELYSSGSWISSQSWTTDELVSSHVMVAGFVASGSDGPGDGQIRLDNVRLNVTYTDPASAPTPQANPDLRMWADYNNVNDAKNTTNLGTSGALCAEVGTLSDWYDGFHAESNGNRDGSAGEMVLGDDSISSVGFDTVHQLARLLTDDAEGVCSGEGDSNNIVNQYRNGSYTAQGDVDEAKEIEAEAPLAIATYWPNSSRLRCTTGAGSCTVGSGDATIRVSTTAADTTPFLTTTSSTTGSVSTSDGSVSADPNWSKDVDEYVGWLRVEDEVIGINSMTWVDNGSNDYITMGVTRGIFGTTAATHSGGSSGEYVYAPVYVGQASGGELHGFPDCDAVSLCSSSDALRYAIRPDADDGEGPLYDFEEFLARQIDTNIGMGTLGSDQGYNGAHLDVSSPFLYNQANAFGTDVSSSVTKTTLADSSGSCPSNCPSTSSNLFTAESYGQAQADKEQLLRDELPANLHLTANNYGWSSNPGSDNAVYDPANGTVDGEKQDIMSTANLYDGYTLEQLGQIGWRNGPTATVRQRAQRAQLDQLIDVAKNNQSAWLWVKTYDPLYSNGTAGCQVTGDNADSPFAAVCNGGSTADTQQMMRYVYGLWMQANRSSSTNAMFGGKLYGVGNLAGSDPADLRDSYRLFFYDLGAPTSDPSDSSGLVNARDASLNVINNVWERTFANGRVIVNTSDTDATVKIAGYWDVTATSSSTGPTWRSGTMTVPAYDAVVLLEGL